MLNDEFSLSEKESNKIKKSMLERILNRLNNEQKR